MRVAPQCKRAHCARSWSDDEGTRSPLPVDMARKAYRLGNVQLCKFHSEGRCNQPWYCRFAHALTELADPWERNLNMATISTDFPLPGRPLSGLFLAYFRKARMEGQPIPYWAEAAVMEAGRAEGGEGCRELGEGIGGGVCVCGVLAVRQVLSLSPSAAAALMVSPVWPWR